MKILAQALEEVGYVHNEEVNADWNYKYLDERAYQFFYNSNGFPLWAYAEINPDMKGFVLRVSLDTRMYQHNEQSKYKVLKCISDINYNMPIGYWSYHPEGKDIRWKMGYYFGDETISKELIKTLLSNSFGLIDSSFREIFAIASSKEH